MQHISFTFELVDEEQDEIINSVRNLVDFWEQSGFYASLYSDKSRQSRFMLSFLTEKSIDELTAMIQREPLIRGLFDKIKESGSRMIISIMDQII